MFGKDPRAVTAAHVAIPCLAWIDPETIFPALLSRVYPSLETLLEV